MASKAALLACTAATVLAGAFLTAATSSPAGADNLVTHHEFQVNCSPSHHQPDDPIVFPGLPGASHDHTFIGNKTTNAATTTQSLQAAGVGNTTCLAPDDLSAYWFPTVYNGNQVILPNFAQVVYYKSGILDYTKVVPFPPGLRYVAGTVTATQDQFQNAPGAIEGWECGDSFHNWDIPVQCTPGSQLNIRYQAPSCWDGVHLDSADHKSHMAYPDKTTLTCPADHPVAVPMLEFKIAFPVSGDMSGVHLASGRGYSWHYDFFNAWDPPTLAALVTHCINGGLQCDPRGFDLYKPDRGTVLGPNYRPPGPGAGSGSGAFNPTDIAWLQLTVPMTENAVTAAHLAADHAASTAVRSAASALEPAQDGFLTRLRAARDRAGLPAGNVHSGHQMPGMITEADLVALRTSHGGDFDQRLVALLRAHSKQIVVLAKGEQTAGADPATQALARDLATAATREAEVLDRTS